MKISVVAVPFALALAFAGPAAAQGDPAAGETKSVVCAACHGPDGNSFNPEWPTIAGQNESYIIKQLNDFRDGVRNDPLMSAQAAALSDEDILDLAAFFSSRTKNPSGVADAAVVERGEAIWRGGNLNTGVTACAACHGPGGGGNEPAGFPALTGQHAAYAAKQMRGFRSSSRSNDLNGMMGMVAERMTDAEIEAVAQFIQGLRRE